MHDYLTKSPNYILNNPTNFLEQTVTKVQVLHNQQTIQTMAPEKFPCYMS